jgi:hypothetical protein
MELDCHMSGGHSTAKMHWKWLLCIALICNYFATNYGWPAHMITELDSQCEEWAFMLG